MKSLKNTISLIFLAVIVFITPLKTKAVTIEEIIKVANSLQPINITEIKNTVSYDYQNQIDEISSILDDSLNSSKYANDKLVELNTLMNSINNDNKALLTIEDKKEYDKSVVALKEKVEEAKQINADAKTSSQNGLNKYNEALVKYVSLKSELEDEKEKTELFLNANISTVNTRLDIINYLLEKLTDNENKLREAYNEANIAYESAKENANVANNNFSDKLEELKEYVEVNSEQELNDLIQANTKYLASGVLYATSQVALKLIDIEIGLVEAEITSLEADLALLDEQLAPYEEVVTNKENELATLNSELADLKESLKDNGTVEQIESRISSAQKMLQELIKLRDDKESAHTKCTDYVSELNTAIANDDKETVVKLLLKNESDYEFVKNEFSVKTEERKNSNFIPVEYFIVTDSDNNEYVYSYELEDDVVTIYNHDKKARTNVTEITDLATYGKYVALFNNSSYDIFNINLLGFGFSGFRVGSKSYEVRMENNSWIAAEKSFKNWQLIDVNTSPITVMIDEHYVRRDNDFITSRDAVDSCKAFETGTINTKITEQNAIISELQNKLAVASSLESQISQKETEITAKEIEVANSKAELNDQKTTLTNDKGMTYVEIENKLAELDEQLNHYPESGDDGFVDDITSIAKLSSLIANATQGNIDVQGIVDAINNLNVGLNIKKTFINEIDKILANNYNKAKQDLIDVAGEDLENISNILKEIAPLISEVAKNNLELLKEKTKYEIAKENYNNLLAAKELVLEAKEETLVELEELEKLKEDNNFDLSNLDAKFKEAEDALISKGNEVEIEINDYVSVEDKNNESENNTSIENEDVIAKEDNNTNETNKNNTTDKDEEKVENNNTIKKEEIKEETSESKEGFNWLNLLWILPIALIFIFIIILIKRKKDED